MALKTLPELQNEIDQAVHTNGPQGKTKAAGLNTVLKSLATELTTQQQETAQALANQTDLSGKDNTWTGINYFSQGLRFYGGNGFDEYGQLYIGQLVIGNKYAWRDHTYTLAKDSTIVWKPTDYTVEQGNPDVGLARADVGTLEVNTGIPGSLATLSALDVVAQAAPPALNSIVKLADALLVLPHKADLDAGGRVPSTQLPSYVDDIIEVADFAALPASGETGKVYIALDTNKQYRWAGSIYALLSDSGLMTAAKEALEASHNPSASNAFVTQAEVALSSNRYADIVSANRTRTYYDSVDAAFNASVSGDTVNLYTSLNQLAASTTEAVLDLHAGVSANLYGIKVTSPTANHDIVTFRGGQQVLNGFNSVLTQNDNGTAGGWFIGTYGGVSVDAYIYDLQLQLITYNSVGFALFGDGTYFYRGNVTSAGRYVVRLSGANAQHFTAHGDIVQSGGGTMFLMTNPAAQLEWNGNITMTDSCYLHMQAGTVVLRGGVLHAENRTPGAEAISVNNGAGTIILENYTVLGIPGKIVLAADKVILRGNTVVVGTIQATTLIDERPVPALVPAKKTEPATGDNLLDLADPDILLDYYINENYIGDTTNLAGWTASGFIPVTANKSYAANNNITHAAWFDAGKQFIANYNSTSGIAPAGAAYLRVSVQSPGFSSLMVVLGTSSEVPATYKKFWKLLLTTTVKPFADKKVGLVGDSLTLQGFYIDSLVSELGAGSYVKEGFSGEVFRSGIDLLPANAFTGCALIQVMFGTNEYGHGGNTLGTTSDSSAANTICGVVRYAYEVLHAQYPTATIYFVTPTERGAFAGEPTSPTPNPYGLTIKLIGDAIKAVCRSLDIPFVDLYDSSNINNLTFAQTLEEDELHWSSIGAAYVGKVIGQAVNQLFS